MPYDLRDFVEDLKKAGELVEINDEVDCDLEIPAYEVISGRFDGPAMLFNNIKGVSSDYRVLNSHFSGSFKKPHKRIAIALGVPPDIDRATWVGESMKVMGTMLRPVEVSSGSCKEVVKMGKDVNLLEYPFTYHAIGDGGKYILLGASTVKDPDSNWTNIGNYAIEVFSKNRLVITAYAHTNFLSIYTNKYEARGNSMPVAISLGGDPAVSIAAGMIMPPGITEYDAAGGLRRTPIELIKCETSDLLVPANAEMVIEGEIRPYERLPEGPKVECFGFSVGPRQPFFAIRVHCITHRKKPIFGDLHTSVGSSSAAMHESLGPLAYLAQAKFFQLPLKLGNYSSIRPAGTTYNCVIKKKLPEDYPGFTEDLLDKVTESPGMGGIHNSNFYMDDDVNMLDNADVFEAMFTQTNPARDVRITSKSHPCMTVATSSFEKEDLEQFMSAGTVLAPKLIVESTIKDEPPLGVRRTRFETLFPEEVQKWVVENWQELGFKEEVQSYDTWLNMP